jgi:hypothetical protein
MAVPSVSSVARNIAGPKSKKAAYLAESLTVCNLKSSSDERPSGVAIPSKRDDDVSSKVSCCVVFLFCVV